MSRPSTRSGSRPSQIPSPSHVGRTPHYHHASPTHGSRGAGPSLIPVPSHGTSPRHSPLHVPAAPPGDPHRGSPLHGLHKLPPSPRVNPSHYGGERRQVSSQPQGVLLSRTRLTQGDLTTDEPVGNAHTSHGQWTRGVPQPKSSEGAQRLDSDRHINPHKEVRPGGARSVKLLSPVHHMLADQPEAVGETEDRSSLGVEDETLKLRHPSGHSQSTIATELTEHAANLPPQEALQKSKVESLQSQLEALVRENLETRAEMRRVQNRRDELEVQVSSLEENLQAEEHKFAALQNEYAQAVQVKEHEMGTVQLEVERLQCSLDCEKEKYSTLELDLSMTNEELLEAREGYSRLTAQLAQVTNRHHKDTEALKDEVAQEKERSANVQDEANRVRDTVGSLRAQLQQREEEVQSITKKVAELEGELGVASAENRKLNAQIQEHKEEVKTKERILAHSEDSHRQTLSSLNHSNDRSSSLSLQLQEREGELSRCRGENASLEHKSAQLNSQLQLQAGVCVSLETTNAELEAQISEARGQVEDLAKKLQAEMTESQHLQVEVEHCRDKQSSLQHQLELQRGTAASSISRLSRQHQQQRSELQSKIQLLKENLREADSSTRTVQQDVSLLRSKCSKLESEVAELRQENATLSQQLTEEIHTRRQGEVRNSELSAAVEKEEKSKTKLLLKLSQESAVRAELQAKLSQQEQVLVSSWHNVTELESEMAKERSQTHECKIQIQLLEVELSSLKQRFAACRRSHEASLKAAKEQSTASRQKHHSEKKALQEKLQETQSNLQALQAQHSSRVEEVRKLEAANRELCEEQKGLSAELAAVKCRLETKDHQCKNAEMKVTSLELQVGQLQEELTTFTQAQLEFEEYKQSVETRSRAEMQRVLAEVTQHMEQQYSSHRYLEKLRAENETMALQEKDRKIDQLRSEVHHRKQESKHNQLQVESLQLESKFFRSQKKEQEKLRQRLESRFDQLGKSLSPHSKSRPKTSSICNHTHT